jgi:TRAP-type uncharacterized transport system fused permease subunit
MDLPIRKVGKALKETANEDFEVRRKDISKAAENAATEEGDATTNPKNMGKKLLRVVYVIAVAMSVYQVWANSFSTLPTLKINVLHLSFLLVLVFLWYPPKGAKGKKKLTA